MSDLSEGANSEPLAIIGFAFKFPSGIESPEAFWEMMMHGETGLSDIPSDRLNLQAFLDISGERANENRSRASTGYFMGNPVDQFDAPFFTITSEEAMAMDPQQRLLLETTYHAFENAGLPLSQVQGSRTSVHVGCLSYDYRLAISRDAEAATKYSVTGTEVSILANRLSWYFNLKGPSISVETACSSSLVALDLASQLLRSKNTNMAIVAGTSLTLMPDLFLYLDNMGFLSPDSRCHSFDSRANGYARSEGLGVIVVKRLDDAIRDKDIIRAVIRSTGSNSDGFTPGITQPSELSQLSLIRDTYEKAGLSMEPTRFCEAHGTGTLLGDPIEANAIGTAFRASRKTDDPLYIGASKANIGHLEAASGIAGIIKSILVLERGVIPPIADLVELNPNIDDVYYKLKFPTIAVPWPGTGLRRASVNSFGFGGTNAHVVLDDAHGFLTERGRNAEANYIHFDGSHQYENSLTRVQTERPYLLTISASDRNGIQRLENVYSSYFAGLESIDTDFCQRLAFTLSNRRTSLPWKSCTIVKSTDSLPSSMSELSIPKRHSSGITPHLAFVFTGQGAQWARMGVELLQYSAYAESIHRSSEYLESLGCPWSLEEEMNKNAAISRMNEPEISQPVSCALQIAIVDLLERANLRPSVVLGHSSGEVAAAYCKGALSHRSAIKIAYFRGMGGAAASRGEGRHTMMSVGLSEADAIAILGDISAMHNDIHIACINSPSNVTLAGDEGHLDALKLILDGKGTFARKLKVPCAYHSPHMIPIAKEYFSRAGELEARYQDTSGTKNIPMLSYLDGKEVSKERLLDLEYWITNMCSAVRFPDSVSGIDRLASLANGRKILDLSHKKSVRVTNILEIGPHSALKGPLREIMKGFKYARDIEYDAALIRGNSGLESFLRAAGSLYCSGFEPDIAYLNGYEERGSKITPLVDLPPYPFAHTRSYWKESRRSKSERLRSCRPNELLGNPSPDWHPFSASWRNFLNRSKSDWLEDHCINDSVLYPGAGMLTMAIEAANQYSRETLSTIPKGFSLKHIEFLSTIQIPEGSGDLEIQVNLRPLDEGTLKLGWFEFEVFSSDNEQWKKSCKGLIRPETSDRHKALLSPPAKYKRDALQHSDTPPNEEKDTNRNSSIPGSPYVLIDATIFNSTTPTPDSATIPIRPAEGFTDIDAVEYFNPTGSGLQTLPTDKFFQKIRMAGYNYGPSFQRIDCIQYKNPGEVTAIVETYEPITSSHKGHGTRLIDPASVIHPATLDAFFQLPLANILRDHSSMPSMIPSKIKSLWISASGLGNDAPPLSATAWYNFSSYRGSEHTVSAVDADNNLKIELSGYEMTRVAGGEDTVAQINPIDLHHCWKFKWESITTLPQHGGNRSLEPTLVEVHVHNPTKTTLELASALTSALEISGYLTCTINSSGKEIKDSANLRVILWDTDQESLLSKLDEENLIMLQRTLNTSNNVLWIQTAAYNSAEFASQHLVDGLSRVVRQEHSMVNFATVSLSSSQHEIPGRVRAISQVCDLLLSGADALYLPQTFRETNPGCIEFYRLTEAAELTEKVQSVKLAPVPTQAVWGRCGPLKLAVTSPGVLDTIHFVEDLEYNHQQWLQDNEVEVEVKAAGVNFKDCLIALGALNENKIGSEISGVVRRVGRDIEGHGLVPGDSVCGFAGDGYRTFYRTKGSSLSRIPSSASLTHVEAASIPVNFATAWHALKHIARLEPGEKVLIHSGAGGTGQAAIQIAKFLGATIFTTVSTQEKRGLLTTKYNIPPSHIFNSRDSKFADEIKHMVGGVDVVLNSLSGDVLFSSWECMEPFGRFVEIGKKDIQSQGRLPMAQFEKNISFNAVDLGHMAIARPKYVAQLVDEVLALFKQKGGFTTVHEIQRFDISDIVPAFRLIGSGKSTGKIVVEMTSDSQIPVLLPSKLSSNFPPNASYIIAGGLGGLGRVAARWMAERGAKHLVLLSRSGARAEDAKAFVKELQDMGVNCLAPACDISNKDTLKETLDSLQIPPIRGCLQSSMVLRSALFADMKHSEWKEATKAKVAGSWNLHELLPRNLDFFILLSSVQAVFGARTQSNYNAANTYMDGLALHRVSKGLKAVSVMLGVVTTDGYLAEAEHQDERDLLLAQNTYHGVETPDFHALLDYYCDASMPLLPVEEAQVTLGMMLLYEDPDLDPLGTIWGRNPMFRALRRLKGTDRSTDSKDSGKKDIASLIAAAKTSEEAAEAVMVALTTRLASTIAGMDPEEMDQSKPIQAYGVDSLQTMELRSWFLRYFKADLPTFSILGAPSLTALANSIVEKSTLRAKA
ncbi:hypothetical protein H072_11126 [Dactylellina haptotyla CBS 200.50]|uniref:Uncharacterized protein n=1 Tax=Dactylellina haptotyla (strain CBS 200.50) TaxID=1284197 RepID=S8BJN7_DACHA|nr:hypothetical protein H072_11126 [Dactylellina haptotyla CBS 200.50]